MSEDYETKPSEQMIRRCKILEWDYAGDGVFVKDELMGVFYGSHFYKF